VLLYIDSILCIPVAIIVRCSLSISIGRGSVDTMRGSELHIPSTDSVAVGDAILSVHNSVSTSFLHVDLSIVMEAGLGAQAYVE
jgi:hypothetical protein